MLFSFPITRMLTVLTTDAVPNGTIHQIAENKNPGEKHISKNVSSSLKIAKVQNAFPLRSKLVEKHIGIYSLEDVIKVTKNTNTIYINRLPNSCSEESSVMSELIQSLGQYSVVVHHTVEETALPCLFRLLQVLGPSIEKLTFKADMAISECDGGSYSPVTLSGLEVLAIIELNVCFIRKVLVNLLLPNLKHVVVLSEHPRNGNIRSELIDVLGQTEYRLTYCKSIKGCRDVVYALSIKI